MLPVLCCFKTVTTWEGENNDSDVFNKFQQCRNLEPKIAWFSTSDDYSKQSKKNLNTLTFIVWLYLFSLVVHKTPCYKCSSILTQVTGMCIKVVSINRQSLHHQCSKSSQKTREVLNKKYSSKVNKKNWERIKKEHFFLKRQPCLHTCPK